jgi:hypothetical protein
MAITSEKIEGTKIINLIESTNIDQTIYDTKTQNLEVTFKNGLTYLYEEVPHQIYTKFRMAESQGSFFNKEISKNFKYSKK